MFNNRFNSTHKDSLVEAVRQAQKDGETRRQAEAHVNEQFGVYSRNAVVREQLAAYDAAIEEAYKCMKEGKPLDPVGREDKDIDNDGDHDKSDKYLLNRRKAIGKAMGKRMEEGAMNSDVVGGGAVTKDNKPVVSSTAPKVNTSGPSASDKAGLAAKIGAMKEDKLEEAAYSAKAARAGKDIGKPGKMFAQIAAKASEKYGSEERGKKVAGAILKKIRAKQVKEENLEELSQFGSAFAAARKAGQSTFNMGGKSYSTAVKGSSSTPTPPSRPSSVSVPKTNTPGTQGVATGKSFADIDRKKMTASATDDMAAKATAKAFFKPGADPNAPKNVPSSTAASMPSSERSSIPTPPSAASAAKAGLPPRRPESLGGSSAPNTPAPAPQAGAPKDDSSKSVEKLMNMKEEVQIGNYKYKII
jgi:hypothetical protein